MKIIEWSGTCTSAGPAGVGWLWKEGIPDGGDIECNKRIARLDKISFSRVHWLLKLLNCLALYMPPLEHGEFTVRRKSSFTYVN